MDDAQRGVQLLYTMVVGGGPARTPVTLAVEQLLGMSGAHMHRYFDSNKDRARMGWKAHLRDKRMPISWRNLCSANGHEATVAAVNEYECNQIPINNPAPKSFCQMVRICHQHRSIIFYNLFLMLLAIADRNFVRSTPRYVAYNLKVLQGGGGGMKKQ